MRVGALAHNTLRLLRDWLSEKLAEGGCVIMRAAWGSECAVWESQIVGEKISGEDHDEVILEAGWDAFLKEKPE